MQTNEYNCGPAAVAFFLSEIEHEGDCSISFLEEALECTPENGTSHESIELFFRGHGYKINAGRLHLDEIMLPMLVNYWDEDDGHYGVITELRLYVGSRDGLIFDPSVGRNVYLDFDGFVKDWYSKRHGDKWALCLAPEETK